MFRFIFKDKAHMSTEIFLKNIIYLERVLKILFAEEVIRKLFWKGQQASFYEKRDPKNSFYNKGPMQFPFPREVL